MKKFFKYLSLLWLCSLNVSAQEIVSSGWEIIPKSGIQFYNAGSPVGRASILDVTGSATVSVTGGTATLNVTGGGGGGTPGGSNTQVQFNDSGSFGGDAGFVYNKTSNIATIDGIILNAETASRVAIIDGSKNIKSADTATYPSLTELSYVKGVTSAIQTQMDTKQVKSLGAYKFHANNTNATANATEQDFEDIGDSVYSGAIAWTGTTAPSGATDHRYRFTMIGKLTVLTIYLNYGTAGSALTQVLLDLPSDAPTPSPLTGTGSASEKIYNAVGWLDTTKTTLPATFRAAMIRDSGNTKYQIGVVGSSNAYRYVQVTVTYWAN